MNSAAKNNRGGTRRRLLMAMTASDPDIPIGVNLVDTETCELYSSMTADGEVAYKAWSKPYVTGYIKVKDSHTYDIRTGADYSACYVCWYDGDKKFIESVKYQDNYSLHGRTFTPSTGAAYVRFTGYQDPASENWGSIKRLT